MNAEPTRSNSDNDPLGCRRALRRTLSRPDLDHFATPSDNPEQRRHAEQAAYRVAVAIGRCRLFDVSPGDLDGTLPLNVALAAARRAADLIEDTLADVDSLDERWTGASCEFEREDIAAGIPEFLMECWATQTALDEALETLGDDPGADADELLTAVDRFEERFAALDRAARAEIGVLATVCDLPLFDNWRDALGNDARAALPWWLDGTLDRHAAEAEADVARLLPGHEHWQAVAPRHVVSEPAPLLARDPAFGSPAQTAHLEPTLAFASANRTTSRVFRWEAPDRPVSARMQIPSGGAQPELLTLVLLGRDEQSPRFGVPKESVRLIGVPAVEVRAEGSRDVADFAWAALERAEQEEINHRVSAAATESTPASSTPNAGVRPSDRAELGGVPELIVGGVRWIPEGASS